MEILLYNFLAVIILAALFVLIAKISDVVNNQKAQRYLIITGLFIFLSVLYLALNFVLVLIELIF